MSVSLLFCQNDENHIKISYELLINEQHFHSNLLLCQFSFCCVPNLKLIWAKYGANWHIFGILSFKSSRYFSFGFFCCKIGALVVQNCNNLSDF